MNLLSTNDWQFLPEMFFGGFFCSSTVNLISYLSFLYEHNGFSDLRTPAVELRSLTGNF